MFQSNAFLNKLVYIYKYIYTSAHICTHAHTSTELWLFLVSKHNLCEWDGREKGITENRQEISSDFNSEMAKKHASLLLKTAPSLLYGILTMLLYIALFGWILLFLYCTAMQNFQWYVLKKEIFNFFRWTYLELNTNLNRIIIFPPHFFYFFLGMSSCPPLPITMSFIIDIHFISDGEECLLRCILKRNRGLILFQAT